MVKGRLLQLMNLVKNVPLVPPVFSESLISWVTSKCSHAGCLKCLSKSTKKRLEACTELLQHSKAECDFLESITTDLTYTHHKLFVQPFVNADLSFSFQN